MKKSLFKKTVFLMLVGCVAICLLQGCEGAYRQFEADEQLEHYQVWEKQYMQEHPDYQNPRILIDIDEKTLYLLDGNQLIKKYVVATGKPSTPTPIGRWKIISKARWGGAFGSRWMQLDIPWGKYGIHGTNQPSSIGYNASHGCIRMHNRDVEDLYTYVKYGTPVYIYGGLYGPFGNGAKNLSPGDRGMDVVEVQRRLTTLGYYKGSIDGVYGPVMERAIYAFQRDNGLPVSRTIYHETYKAMGIIMVE